MLSKNEILYSFSYRKYTNTYFIRELCIDYRVCVVRVVLRVVSHSHNYVRIVRINVYSDTQLRIHIHSLIYTSKVNFFCSQYANGHIDCVQFQLFSDSQLCSFSNLSKFAKEIIKLEKSKKSRQRCCSFSFLKSNFPIF